jgi:hypothetical protein
MFKRAAPILPMRSPGENAERGITIPAVRAYEAGELDTNEIVSLGQDIYEAGVLPKLPPRYFLLIEHLKRVGLIHMHGRALH